MTGGVAIAVAVLAVSGGLVLLALRRTLVAVEITGESMAPTFAHGDRVLVRRRPLQRIRIGDVVVFEQPDWPGEWHRPPGRGQVAGRQWVIKRVTALPGDPLPASPSHGVGSGKATTVPHGSLFVLGDNTEFSTDSREVGCIPEERMLGVMLRRLESPRAAETR